MPTKDHIKKKHSLGNGITSDTTLREWGKAHIDGFLGVISRDDIRTTYPQMSPGDSIIINLDPNYSQGGTHWVALRVSSEAPIVYYKDSFGGPPPNDIINTITNRGLIYGNRIYQKLTEENCGKRAAYFLKDMADYARKKREIERFEELELD